MKKPVFNAFKHMAGENITLKLIKIIKISMILDKRQLFLEIYK